LAEYNTLQQYDTAELMSVSFGTPENATLNVLSVLSQWAALQTAQQTALQQATSSSSDANGVPTLDSLISQSDAAAQTVLNNYASAPPGSSIIDYQA
jgi:hypothetical protein